MSTTIIGCLVLVGVAIAAASALLGIRRSFPGWNESMQWTAGQLGFSQVDEPDEDFVERIRSLFDHSQGKTQLRNFFESSGNGPQMYLFDALRPAKIESQSRLPGHMARVEETVLGIRSPELDLPRFRLVPKPDVKGILGSALNAVVDQYSSATASRVPIEEDDEFDRRYVLAGPDASAVRRLLSEPVRARLLEVQNLMIEGEGDTLAFTRVDLQYHRCRGRAPGEWIQDIVRQCVVLFDVFQGTTAEPERHCVASDDV